MGKLAAVISVLLLTVVTANAAPADRWLQNAAGHARALELQRELRVPLVVYFYADWCPYCHRLERDYFPAAPVQQYLRSVVKVRINPEHGPAELELAERYGFDGYPSFFIMNTSTSSPRMVHPFRRGGNLTPAEFARECQEAGPVSTSDANTSKSPGVLIYTPGTSNQGKLQAQIVEVPATATPTRNNAPLPTLDTVLAKYVAAIGGREAQRKITSRVSKGRVDVPGVSFGGKVEVYAKAPNKTLLVTNVESAGVIKQGFDGRSAWANTADIANGLDRAALVDIDFYRETKLGEQYTRMKLVGKVKEDLREVYLVEAVRRDGATENLYFDIETGLLARRDLPRKRSVRVEIYYHDWRDIDGVRLPFMIMQVLPAKRFVITVEEVKHNVPLDDAMFIRP